jgi:hypothetical protein
MKKEIVKALAKIPKRFISDGTSLVEFDNSVIVANDKFPPVIYRGGIWTELAVFTKRPEQLQTIKGWGK